MRGTERHLPDLLNQLRWVIPTLMAIVGIAYILFEHLLIIPGQVTPIHTFRQAMIIGSLGPVLAWLLLSWATAIARSRQQTEEALERRALQLEIASLVSQKVTAILEVDELLAQVVKLIREKFGYYHVHLFLVEESSAEIVLRECSGQAVEWLRNQGLRFKIGQQGITGWVAQSGQPVLCNNVSQEPRYYPHELLAETKSEAAIPLRVGQKVVGVLDVQSKQQNAFHQDDLTTLQILGDQIAIAIENANLFQTAQRQIAAMRALHDISLEITSRLDSDRVLGLVLEQAVDLLNAQASALSIYDSGTGLVRIVATKNLDYESVELPIGEGSAGKVIATGKPLVINDYPNWEGRSPVFKDSPYDAIISVPLFWQGEVFGVLSALDRGERRPFSDDDVKLMSLFADLASIALKNSELFSQVVQLSQTLEQKVEQRTVELVRAQQALAQKAEQLQRLLSLTVHVQEEERTRIARDLHDGLNQLLTAILFELQAAQECINSRRWEDALDRMATAKKLSRTIEAENRRIIYGLRPPILDTQGLVPALKWSLKTVQEYYGIAGSFQICGEPMRLSSETETAVYRIVQETLNNVAEHAQAQIVQIQVAFNLSRLQVTIQDDGIGFDDEGALAASSEQMGLIGMKERAQSIGGQIDIRSIPGRGTRVTLHVPLAPDPLPAAI